MAGLTLIKIFNDFSLIFLILEFIFLNLSSISISGAFFLYLCLMTFAIFLVGRTHRKWKFILVPTVFLPFVLVKTEMDVAFLLIACSFGVYLAVKGLEEISYSMLTDGFKKGIGVIMITFLMSMFAQSLIIFENELAQYIIIYLVSSVILLRTLRYMEYNKESRNLNKINLGLSALLLLLSLTFSIDYVRNIVQKSLLQAYNFIFDIFLYLISWIFLGIGYMVQFLVTILSQLLHGIIQAQPPIEKYKSPLDDLKNLDANDLLSMILNNKYLKFLLQAILVLLIVIIIVKLLKRYSNSKRDKEEYIECREAIKAGDISNAARKISTIFKPRGYAEYIRYYYRKFLKLCIDKGIEIKNTDTTLEISRKSQQQFDADTVREMRKIYIGARYNEETGERKTISSFYNMLIKLKK